MQRKKKALSPTIKINYLTKREKQKSHKYFRTTRVESCVKVNKVKGFQDQFKAEAFYPRRISIPLQSHFKNRVSWSNFSFSVKEEQYAGMPVKKLTSSYNPNAFRSRLRTRIFLPHYRNTNIIRFGETQRSYNQFQTTYRKSYDWKRQVPCNNPAVKAFRNKWVKRKML